MESLNGVRGLAVHERERAELPEHLDLAPRAPFLVLDRVVEELARVLPRYEHETVPVEDRPELGRRPMKLLNEAPPLKFWRRLMTANPPLSQTTTMSLCPVRTDE